MRRPSESEVVAAYQQRNYGLAFELAEPLAREGCDECQFIMGRLYETGAAGKKDAMPAADWYRKAAEGGNAKARFNLGNLYLAGNGVIKDARSAAEWFHKAAVGGHRVAQFNLGMMYETGEGINRDVGEAVKWYGEAAQSDDPGSGARRARGGRASGQACAAGEAAPPLNGVCLICRSMSVGRTGGTRAARSAVPTTRRAQVLRLTAPTGRTTRRRVLLPPRRPPRRAER